MGRRDKTTAPIWARASVSGPPMWQSSQASQGVRSQKREIKMWVKLAHRMAPQNGVRKGGKYPLEMGRDYRRVVR